MSFKDWFGMKEPEAPAEIGDLIVLERWDEAEQRLLAKIKANQQDTSSQMKLAEVYVGMEKPDKAVDQYVVVADQWSQQGFHDRSIALLYKAMKLHPDEETTSRLFRKVERLKGAKAREVKQRAVLDGIRSREQKGDRQATITALEVERAWRHIDKCGLIRDLEAPVLKQLFSVMEMVHVDAGAIFVDKGDRAESLFFIVQGVLDVVTPSASAAIRSFTAGDIVGERALFRHRPWVATYRVGENLSAMRIQQEGVQEVLQGNPDPRAFLDTLRSQGNDAEVARLLRELGEEVD